MIEKILASDGYHFRTDEDWELAERCKADKELWKRVYAKIRLAEEADVRRSEMEAEKEKRR